MEAANKIKVTLKPFLKSSEHFSILVKRLNDVHYLLVDFKLSYTKDYILNKTVVFHTQREHVPHWCSEILPILSEYLDVYMYQVGFLMDNHVEPSKTIMVLGSKEQTALAKTYLNFLIPSIDAYVLNHKTKLEKEAKKIREEIREGKREETERMGDIRIQSSDYRTEIIKSIKEGLLILLDWHKRNEPIAHTRGINRRAQIKAKIEHNGEKIWHNTKLLSNFLKKEPK